MNVYLVCVSDHYYRNRIFDIHNRQNRDHAYDPFHLLRQMLADRKIDLNTYDYFDRSLAQDYRLLFFDVPRNIRRVLAGHHNVPKYLVLFEPEIIMPANGDRSLHQHFTKIFTWDDRLADGRKYIKINVPCHFPRSIRSDLAHKAKLCTMVAGNKKSSHPGELYSERVRAVRWFERHHPGDFDLYGYGWDEYRFGGSRPFRALNLIKPLTRLLAPEFPSYRGSLESKKAALERYRFAICYENVRDVPGYITEKIFDCFGAGCVPVYWGAPNIGDHIPSSCFIDKREFPSYDQLYARLRSMSDGEYRRYLEAISTFLDSNAAHRFSGEAFANSLAGEIANG